MCRARQSTGLHSGRVGRAARSLRPGGCQTSASSSRSRRPVASQISHRSATIASSPSSIPPPGADQNTTPVSGCWERKQQDPIGLIDEQNPNRLTKPNACPHDGHSMSTRRDGITSATSPTRDSQPECRSPRKQSRRQRGYVRRDSAARHGRRRQLGSWPPPPARSIASPMPSFVLGARSACLSHKPMEQRTPRRSESGVRIRPRYRRRSNPERTGSGSGQEVRTASASRWEDPGARSR